MILKVKFKSLTMWHLQYPLKFLDTLLLVFNLYWSFDSLQEENSNAPKTKAGFFTIKVLAQVPKTANLKKQPLLFSVSPLSMRGAHSYRIIRKVTRWRRNCGLDCASWLKDFCREFWKALGRHNSLKSWFNHYLTWKLVKHYQICASVFCCGKYRAPTRSNQICKTLSAVGSTEIWLNCWVPLRSQGFCLLGHKTY